MSTARIAAAVLVATVAALLSAASASFAHVSYNGAGQFMHQSHSRDMWFLNDVDADGWRAQTRDAQIQIDNVFNGSIRLGSTSNHDASVIHAVDDVYDAGIVGRAYWWDHHGGHGHLQLNNSYNYLSTFEKQATACHEIGHFVGLAHSNDATDCLHTPLSSMPSRILGYDHRDQMRSAWNATGH